VEPVDELEDRHAELVERDRWVGLEAEAEAARAHAARLEAKLAVAQQRLDRKNARIRQLAARVKELESAAADPGLGTRLARAVRRG
jgi:chromosome segregation ATPase